MLVQTISNWLVNGLKGKVVNLSTNKATVVFDNMPGQMVNINRYQYYHYSAQRKQNIAGRLQLQLKLTFAATVYKCQGQTLDNVVVHCKTTQRPGELAVAVGRVRQINRLQLVDFSVTVACQHH